MEQELIQALRDIIFAKNELIDNLRAEIDRLKSTESPLAAPRWNPDSPLPAHPCPPHQQPLVPMPGMPDPQTPWYGTGEPRGLTATSEELSRYCNTKLGSGSDTGSINHMDLKVTLGDP